MNNFNVYPWFFKYYFNFNPSMFYQQQEKKRSLLIYCVNLFLSCIFIVVYSSVSLLFIYRDIPCQLTHFSAFFCRPSPILLKFDMFVGLDEKISHTKFQVSKSNSF